MAQPQLCIRWFIFFYHRISIYLVNRICSHSNDCFFTMATLDCPLILHVRTEFYWSSVSNVSRKLTDITSYASSIQLSQSDISDLKYLINVTLLFFFSGLSSGMINVAVNYVAISEALGVSPSVLAAGVAADNVITALYFLALFALASRTPSEPPTSTDGT